MKRVASRQLSMTWDDGLVVDLFAGGGGASVGMERALGRVDIAINHDARAIRVHEVNHPRAKHYHCDVWEVDPREAVQGKPVSMLWASPDCTFFSKARGTKPFRDRRFANRRRALATVITRWAKQTRPRVIAMENVEEFTKWGPLNAEGSPIKEKAGLSFNRFVAQFKNLGYQVDWKILTASDHGSGTSRSRLFLVARCDDEPITWPKPTHGKGGKPVVTAADIIDWQRRCPSIFERKRPLADATNRRIARGIIEKVIMDPNPFVIDKGYTLISRGYGERPGQVPRVPGLDKPLGTIVAQGRKHALVCAYMARHWGGMTGNRLDDRPWPTLTTKGCQDNIVELKLEQPFSRQGEVRAFLQKYYGTGICKDVRSPCDTFTTKARMGVVTVEGVDRQITDIGMRMLSPREMFRAHGFPERYIIDPVMPASHSSLDKKKAKPLGVTDQVFLVGNSVCCDVAEAVVSANIGVR